jgi:UDP-N-acetylmuramoyl-tripeptide--D-alanyl-D-alanine ligase
MTFDADALARASAGRVLRPGGAGPLCTDSRALRAGDWFVALRGPRFDGHDFVGAAWAAGAGVIVDHVPADLAGPCVAVDDTRRALQDVARTVREAFRGPVVGLTGSAGKTTTRALCALALGGSFRVHATEGNLNNDIGLPLTLVATPPEATALVLELGTSSPGEIAALAAIATPTVRLVVNVGPAHLEELGGIEGVAREKCALFDSARPGDVCVVNEDDEWLRDAVLPAATRRLSFGTAASCDVRLVSADVDATDLTTRAVYEGAFGTRAVRLGVPGAHVALDGAAAVAVAMALGVPAADAVDALARYAPVGMRQRIERTASGVVVVNDTYNANPTSVRASLVALRDLPGRRVAVLGDMLELGADEDGWHREVLEFALSLALDRVVVCGPRMARNAPVGVEVAADVDAVAKDLGATLRPGDSVLVKGSRGARMERVVAALLAGEA